jgi:hypothetical protein
MTSSCRPRNSLKGAQRNPKRDNFNSIGCIVGRANVLRPSAKFMRESTFTRDKEMRKIPGGCILIASRALRIIMRTLSRVAEANRRRIIAFTGLEWLCAARRDGGV